MNTLAELQCAPCRGTEDKLTDVEIEEMLSETPEWKLIEVNDEKRIVRSFKFDDFRSALEFTDDIGEIAEENDHHPAILTEWGKVTVNWWTHKIGGLHRNDFIMAAKCDEVYEDFVS